MSRPILTAQEMRAAEAGAVAAGISVETLMDRAGAAAADAIWRYSGALPALVLCGPGNNGGDGYVIARCLAERGMDVRVATLGEPKSAPALSARSGWQGPVEDFETAAPAPLLIDALFGTGLTRPLDGAAAQRLCTMAEIARVRVAVDLPSGVATDDGRILSPVPFFDLTITFATLKPSHLLQPAARHMGRIVVADIGIAAESRLQEIARPRLAAPCPDDHKYSRGYVAVVAGEMPGAASLAASAALRSGAGYVRLFGDASGCNAPQALVRGGEARTLCDDKRIDVIAAGPGLGRSRRAEEWLNAVDATRLPLVLDGDALHWLGENPRGLGRAILTPHAGEFSRLFGHLSGSKIEQTRSAAASSGAVVVYKGPDTIVAAPDGRAIAGNGSHWLATAGTGDVLTGVVAAMRARGLNGFEAACAGVWLHGRAAELAGPGLIADDLPDHLSAAFAECL